MRQRNISRKIFSMAMFMMALCLVGNLYAADLDNKGNDFIMTFLPNHSGGSYVELHLTSDVATDVTVDWPYDSPTFSTTVSLTPGVITIVSLPTAAANSWTPGVVSNMAVHAYSDDEFICYMINRLGYTSDAALGLPTDVMNTDFIVVMNTGTTLGSWDGGEFAVVAREDNTTVTITPTQNMAGGFSAGVPFDITLNLGEAFLGRSTANGGTAADLSGTLIEADKPVGMTNGNRCTNVPSNITACDHVFEVAQPLQSWGNQVFVANLPLRPYGSIYKIVAGADNTTITEDGTSLGTFNKGEFFVTSVEAGNHVFEGDNAIFVVQFMPGQGYTGNSTGDPAMGNMAPSEQYLYDYTFSTVGGGQFAANYLTIIANNSDVTGGTILLDGSTVAAGLFTAVPGTDWSAAVVSLTDGTHTTSSASMTHGITVEGYNDYDSYIYPGGALFVPINPVNDTIPPVCNETSNDGCTACVTATDDGVDDAGIFLVRLDAGYDNLVLTVDPFDQGDPSVSYCVTTDDQSMPGSGSVTVIDGEGNTCTERFELNCGQQEFCGQLSGYVYMADPLTNLQGVKVTLYNGMGDPMSMTYTDQDGLYEFFELGEGDYFVGIEPPLGFCPVTEPMVDFSIEGCAIVGVDFKLEDCSNGKTTDLWWWKNQFKAIKTGEQLWMGLTEDDVNGYLQRVFDHFYSRMDGNAIQIEGVTFMDMGMPRPLDFDDILDIFFDNVDLSDAGKTRASLLIVMLNVVSGRLSQLAVVSDDGATASQAITYYAEVYQSCCSLDWTAWYNLHKIHMSMMIGAGVIPLSTPNIMYKNDPGTVADMMPKEFDVRQNYPNPFNPTTTIQMTLPEAAPYTVTIYNVTGQKVGEINGSSSYPGETVTVEWDGSAQGSGVYFYKVDAGKQSITRKMVLLK
jgi:hypothetical protein